MRRKLLPVLALAGALFFTACQEDDTIDELIQDTSDSPFDLTATGNTNSNGGVGDAVPGDN